MSVKIFLIAGSSVVCVGVGGLILANNIEFSMPNFPKDMTASSWSQMLQYQLQKLKGAWSALGAIINRPEDIGRMGVFMQDYGSPLAWITQLEDIGGLNADFMNEIANTEPSKENAELLVKSIEQCSKTAVPGVLAEGGYCLATVQANKKIKQTWSESKLSYVEISALTTSLNRIGGLGSVDSFISQITESGEKQKEEIKLLTTSLDKCAEREIVEGQSHQEKIERCLITVKADKIINAGVKKVKTTVSGIVSSFLQDSQ